MTITLVCTDREQHPAVSFGYLDVWREIDEWAIQPYLDVEKYVDREPLITQSKAIDDTLTSSELLDRVRAVPARLHTTYPLKCKRCGRDIPLRAETLEKLSTVAADNGIATIDLSKVL